MPCDSAFKNPKDAQLVLEKIAQLSGRTGPVRLMEVCGTHTMSIARTGLKSLLPAQITLLSGPGCPVCVTPAGAMDAVFALAKDPHILLASYGDLLRIPGTQRKTSLLSQKAKGARVESVYSPMDALRLAKAHPELEVVFLGVGFETTAPGTAACILQAASEQLPNFSVLCLLKRTEPALRSLIEAKDFGVSGFLCPGHVAAVTGSDAFSFLPKDYGLPAVVAGFDAADLLYSVAELMRMLADGRPGLKNEYVRVVRPEGNPAALSLTDRVFSPCDAFWRGLGCVSKGGFAIREEFAPWDSARKFGFSFSEGAEPPGCCCAQVIRGVVPPTDCPLFGKACTPQDPIGPCMVSSEGACAAAYRYRQIPL